VCNLYSITTNQAAISGLFRVVSRYVGNLAPMPGVFPDYTAPIVRTGPKGRELATARWGMPSSNSASTEAELRAALNFLDRDDPVSANQIFDEAMSSVAMPEPP
jgi:putative SOS response-associated peptidase YedK